MAMELDAVLADELSRTDASGPSQAPGFYETRRKQRVEAAQADSRHLARQIARISGPPI